MSNRSLIKNASIYSLATLFQRALGFLLLPLYTFFLTPAEYGIVGVINTMVGFLSMLFSLGLNNAILRFYSTYRDDDLKLRNIVGSLLSLTLLTVFILSVLVLLGHRLVIDPFLESIPFYPYMLVGVITVIFRPLFVLYLSFLQAQEKGKIVGKNSILFFVVNFVQILVYLIFFKMRALSPILSLSLTNTVFGLYGFVKLYRYSGLRLHLGSIRQSLVYGLPLVPNNLALWVMSAIDRLLINRFLGIAEVGLYHAGSQFSNLLGYIGGAIQTAYTPWFFKKIEEKDHRSIVEMAEMLTNFYVVTAIGLSFFAPDIMGLVTQKDFFPGWKVVPILSFAFVMQGMHFSWYNIVLIRWSKFAPLITLSGAMVHLCLNLIFIPGFQIMGAATASLISKTIVSVISYLVGRRLYKIDFRWSKMYITAAAGFLLSSSVYLIHERIPNTLVAFGLKVVLFGTAIFYLYGVYKKSIRSAVKKFMLAKRGK